MREKGIGPAAVWAWALLAGALGFVLDRSPITIAPDAVLPLGRALPLVVATVLGPLPGMVSAAVAALPLPATGGLPGAALLAVAEAAVVGVLAPARTATLLAGLFFWSALGMPAAIATAWLLLGGVAPNAAPLAALALTGLVSAVLAELAVDALSQRVRVGRLRGIDPRMPLRIDLLRGFVVVASVPLLVVSVAQQRRMAGRESAAAQEALDEVARAVAREIDGHVQKHLDLVQAVASNLRAEAVVPGPGLDRSLARVHAVFDDFVSMLVADSTGRLVSASLPAPAALGSDSIPSGTVADRPYFRGPMETGRTFVSKAFPGRGVGTDPIVAVSAPILAPDGRPVGIVEGSLDLARFARFGRVYALRLDADLLVVDEERRALFASAGLGVDPLGVVADPPPSTSPRPSRSGGRADGRDVPRLVGAATLTSAPWKVFLERPEDDVMAAVRAEFVWTVLAIFATTALAIVLARLLGARLSRPIEALVAHVRAFRADRETTRLTPLEGAPAEVAHLADHYRRMVSRLSGTYAELNLALDERDHATAEMEALLTELDDRVRLRTAELAEATESAAAASRAKSEFLARMSHEIRTPMNGIISVAQFLLDGPLEPDQRKLATTVHDSAGALLHVVNEILDFSKIEAGRMELTPEAFDVQACVRGVVDAMAGPARAKGLSLRPDLGPSLPAVVVGDGPRLRQVLLNLAGNAVKFTERGSVVVRASVASGAPTDGETTRLRFEVEDSGIGIPEKDRARIFESFSQADGTAERHYGGTGLGLTISSRLVELMGGRLAVESRWGAGSTFSFEIDAPVHVWAGAPQRRAAPAPASGREHPGRGERILVAEDNLTNQMVATRLLEGLGFIPVLAADGVEALEAVEASVAEPFAAILMDLHMPRMDGCDAARLIRERERELGLPHVPILAVTASVLQQDRDRARRAGMDGFVTKPIEVEPLLDAIRDVLEPEPAPPLPPEALARRRSARMDELLSIGGPTMLREILDVFAEDSRKVLAGIRDAVRAEDAPRAGTLAHGLKGSSLNVGADAVADLARRLESLGKACEPRGMGTLVDDLEIELEAVLLEMERAGVDP